MTDPNLPVPATEEDWAALNSFGGAFGGPAKRCLFDLRDRLATLEARLEASPAEPAPQAQQGVTVEELASTIAYVFSQKKPGNNLSAAYDITVALWSDPRLGPLLGGEGATKPVVLPEEPPINTSGRSLTELAFMAYRDGCRATWAAARAEVERQQGGQADV